MKILMIIKRLDYSGAPKMFMWVANNLAKRGMDVTILNVVCKFAICAEALSGVQLSTSEISAVVRHKVVKITVPMTLNVI